MSRSVNKSRSHLPVWILLSIFSILAILLFGLLFLRMTHQTLMTSQVSDVAISTAFHNYVENAVMEAEAAARSVDKVYWLNKDAKEGPVPNQDNYGAADDPVSLQWLLDDAEKVLDGQDTLFSTDRKIFTGSQITYYLDETIFAITWKELWNNSVYTISEIKIADPSQFRRHVADHVFDSPNLYPTTEMSRAVNAVVGSSADHYRGRNLGIIVYDGEVKRVNRPDRIDTCYIDDNGDLLLSHRGELTDIESAQAFVDEHHISFSLAFGPIVIEDGVRCDPDNYLIGEINDEYARAALCQLDDLHYLIVTASYEPGFWDSPTVRSFTDVLVTFDCKSAYILDGGNTAAIAMDGALMNRTPYGHERNLGDIIYFCTAIPNKRK